MPAKKQTNNTKSFPHKLHALLESATAKDFAHIISWQPGGKSFKVHQPKVFVKSILPVYFKQSKFKSFLRQLNIYGFQRIQYGPNKGGYTHQHLVQGVPELCLMIKRVSAPDGGGKAVAPIMSSKNVVVPPNLCSSTRKRSSMTPSTINIVPSDEPISPCKESLGSFGSLGSLGSLGMNGPETNFDLGGSHHNEPFHISCDGLSSFVGSGGSLGGSRNSCTSGSGQQYEPYPLKDDCSAFGKPFLERDLSLLSNLSFGSLSQSSSTKCQGVRMNASELDLFKDLFQTSDLEDDVPMLFPSSDKHNGTPHNLSTSGYHRNSVFEHPSVSRGPGSGTSLGPEYVTSNGFLNKKPGCLEPSVDELLSLVTETSERNEDLNRSEAVFPSKLHRMLQDAKREGFDHIVSWIHGGTAFKVHDIPLFMEKIMPIYFDQSKFESFRRQLNLYGFTRVTKGPSRGMYYHQDFVQNDPSLCQNITRPKSFRQRKTASATEARVGAVA